MLMFVAVLLVALSALPAPIWLYAVGGAIVIAWFLTIAPSQSAARRRAIMTLRAVTPLFALLAIALELPHQILRRLPAARGTRVFVVGDSLSADVGANIQPWPALLARDHGLSVVNVAAAGATAEEGRRQADRLPDEDGIVVVLIGGNDVIAGRAPGAFERDLDHVLARASSHGRPVVMFELPLPPLANGYGCVQRRLAARHGVTLIPRRHLALRLARPAATTDGLHLSAKGHAAVADLVWLCIGEACQATPRPATSRRRPS